MEGPVYTVGNNQVDAIYTVVALSAEEVIQKAKAPFEAALENMLDAKARERTWKNITSAIAAASRPGVFQADAILLADYWELCWVKAHTILAEVQAGTRPIPTVEEFLAEMPNLSLPE